MPKPVDPSCNYQTHQQGRKVEVGGSVPTLQRPLRRRFPIPTRRPTGTKAVPRPGRFWSCLYDRSRLIYDTKTYIYVYSCIKRGSLLPPLKICSSHMLASKYTNPFCVTLVFYLPLPRHQTLVSHSLLLSMLSIIFSGHAQGYAASSILLVCTENPVFCITRMDFMHSQGRLGREPTSRVVTENQNRRRYIRTPIQRN